MPDEAVAQDETNQTQPAKPSIYWFEAEDLPIAAPELSLLEYIDQNLEAMNAEAECCANRAVLAKFESWRDDAIQGYRYLLHRIRVLENVRDRLLAK